MFEVNVYAIDPIPKSAPGEPLKNVFLYLGWDLLICPRLGNFQTPSQ